MWLWPWDARGATARIEDKLDMLVRVVQQAKDFGECLR